MQLLIERMVAREGNECVFRSVMQMIEQMKQEIAKVQQIPYPEQITVAQIYNLTADALAEACRRIHNEKPSGCDSKEVKKVDVSYDTFILLNQLKEDGRISASYADALFEMLLKMNPDIEEKVRSDRQKGMV